MGGNSREWARDHAATGSTSTDLTRRGDRAARSSTGSSRGIASDPSPVIDDAPAQVRRIARDRPGRDRLVVAPRGDRRRGRGARHPRRRWRAIVSSDEVAAGKPAPGRVPAGGLAPGRRAGALPRRGGLAQRRPGGQGRRHDGRARPQRERPARRRGATRIADARGPVAGGPGPRRPRRPDARRPRPGPRRRRILPPVATPRRRPRRRPTASGSSGRARARGPRAVPGARSRAPSGSPRGPAIYCFNHLNWSDPLVLLAVPARAARGSRCSGPRRRT